MAPALENGWHTLPCGARVRVFNGNLLAITIKDIIDPQTGAMPPTDSVALKEASDFIQHRVEFTSTWMSDRTGMYKTANLQKKVMLDEPEQI
jgi:hypothetical protein